MKTLVLLFSFFLISTWSTSSLGQTSPDLKNSTYESSKIWLGIPASLYIGFGLGHAIQDRYSDYGWIYTAIDSASALALLLTFGDCADIKSSCQVNKDHQAETAKSVLVASRLVQIIDTSIWSYNYYNKFHSSAYLLPSKNGLELSFNFTF